MSDADQAPSEEGDTQSKEESGQPTPPFALTLAPRQAEGQSPAVPVLIVLTLAGLGGLGWYVSQPSPTVGSGATSVSEDVPKAIPLVPTDLPEGASSEPAAVPAPIFKTERFAFPLSGFAVRLPTGYPQVERDNGTQRMTTFGPPLRSLQITMAPIYPWLSARRIEKNNPKSTWQSGAIHLPEAGIRISLPDHVRWSLERDLKTIYLIAGDRLFFISSPFLLDRAAGLGGIVSSFELLDASYQDVYIKEHELTVQQALGKPSAEVRARVDQRRRALEKDDRLPNSVLRGFEAHTEDMLTLVGTLMLADFLKVQAERRQRPKRARPPRPPGSHDHDHEKPNAGAQKR